MSQQEADAASFDLMGPLAAGADASLADLWRARITRHHRDTYAGVQLSKFPEDLKTYEHLMWMAAPQVVIELGVQFAGSTLWLRDRLFDFQRYRGGPAPRVIAVDIELGHARETLAGLPPEASAGIEFLEGDVNDPAVLDAVRDTVPEGADVLVIEDAAHDAETTAAGLRALAPLVRSGGFYVVEDTCVDVEALRPADGSWPRGAGVALDAWLADDPLGRRFRRRGDLQPYGLTCHPGGVLQRMTDL